MHTSVYMCVCAPLCVYVCVSTYVHPCLCLSVSLCVYVYKHIYKVARSTFKIFLNLFPYPLISFSFFLFSYFKYVSIVSVCHTHAEPLEATRG